MIILCVFIVVFDCRSEAQEKHGEITAQFNFQTSIRNNTNGYSIDSNLEKYGAQINSLAFVPSIVSLEVRKGDLMAELGFGVAISKSDNDDYGNQYRGGYSTLQLGYKVSKSLVLGASFNYEGAKLSVYSKSNDVDIERDISSSSIQFKSSFITVGPLIRYYINDYFLSIGYNVNIFSSDWSVPYDNNPSSAIRESGVSQLCFTIGSPLLKLKSR